jgi:rifampin ADP-ribosylating transferase
MRRVVLADGSGIAVHEQGAGTPVVLVHAWGETHRSFDRLAELLPNDLRVLAPDQRGVGQSDKTAVGYRLEDAAADLVGVLDALEVPAAWIVGTSSGGYVAQQLAVSHQERVLGLVLVGAPRSLAGSDRFGEILEAFGDPVTADDIAALTSSLGFPASIPRDFLDAQDAAALTIPRHVWLAGYRGLVEACAPTETGTIRVPTLLLSGADDHLLGPDDTIGLAGSIPSSRHHVYEQTGHFVLWERPDAVVRDLVNFIRDRTPNASVEPSTETN